MKVKIPRFNMLVLIFTLILFGVTYILAKQPNNVEQEAEINTKVESRTKVEIKPVPDINSIPLMHNTNVNNNEDQSSVVYLYATIIEGAASDYADNTWYEVNQAVHYFGVTNPTIRSKVILQEGDENGPAYGMFGYGLEMPNGVISVRGQSSTHYKNQKSYQVELFDNTELWRNTSNIALNKHIYDDVRIRNKLSYRLIDYIPGLISPKTQFVHLFVKDETVYPAQTEFVSYGLFTQVQPINKEFLRNHGLDEYGQMYKIRDFNFYKSDDLRLESDENFNLEKFELIIAPLGATNDHQKIIDMIADVNDFSLDIDYVLEKHFDMESYLTWFAFNMLTGNYDSINQNYVLYSPLNSNTWYFIPWDMDGNLVQEEVIDSRFYPRGVSVYWEVVLHRRALKSESFRNQLIEKMEATAKIITPHLIQKHLDMYYPVASYFVNRMPDKYFFEISRDTINFEEAWHSLPYNVLMYKEKFFNSFNVPQPFFISPPEIRSNDILFEWDASYHLNNEMVTYSFYLATDIYFNNTIVTSNNFISTMILIDMLPPGTYYYKIIAEDESGHQGKAYGTTRDENKKPHFGVHTLTIS